MAKPMVWGVLQQGTHEGIVSEDGRFKIVSTLVGERDKAKGLSCSLLDRDRWVADHKTQRHAKAQAELLRSSR